MDLHGGTMPLETRFTGNQQQQATPNSTSNSTSRSSDDDERTPTATASALSSSAEARPFLEQLELSSTPSDVRVIRKEWNPPSKGNPTNNEATACASVPSEVHQVPLEQEDSKLPPLSPPRVSTDANDDNSEEFHPSPFSSSYVSGIGPQDEDGADLLQLLTLQEVEENPEASKVPSAFGSLRSPSDVGPRLSSNPIPDHQDQNSLASDDDAQYFDDDELEEIQSLRRPPSQLLIRNTLEHLTEEVMEAMVQSNRYQTLFLDHVMPVAHARALLHPPLVDFEEEDEDEEGTDEDAIPALSSEPSHTSAVLALDHFQDALGMNISITHVSLNACHPKVIETTLWGLSCMPSRLSHLSLDFWPVADPHRNNYLIWDGLVEILTNTQTLRSLHIASHFDDDDSTAINWSLLARGVERNRSLHFVSLETLQWTREGMDLLTAALAQHPHLGHAPLLRDRDNPSHVTAERPPVQATTPLAAASSASTPLEDSTNSVRRAKLVKVVSEDTVKLDHTNTPASSTLLVG